MISFGVVGSCNRFGFPFWCHLLFAIYLEPAREMLFYDGGGSFAPGASPFLPFCGVFDQREMVEFSNGLEDFGKLLNSVSLFNCQSALILFDLSPIL